MTDMTPPTARTETMEPVTAGARGDGPAAGRPAHADSAATGRPRRRLATETKSAFKTTEFWIYAAAVAAVLIASRAVGSGAHHGDYFRADRAWLYVVILTVGYLLSRGFAKSGSRQPYDQ